MLKIIGCNKNVNLDDENVTEEISLTVSDVQLWDINDPHLYRVEITIKTEYGVHTHSMNFGFREFKVKDGFFYLNGQKIFLKSSHSGNAFPIGQNFPVIKEHIRQDMLMAKTYGLNMVRAIAGMFRPEQLDVCDEIGFMIYEECMAAWQLGAGENMLDDPNQDLGDARKMMQRFDHSTIQMILCYREAGGL